MRRSCPIPASPPQRFRPLPERRSALSAPSFHPLTSTKSLFLYTPAAAGGYVEELLKRPAGPINDDERNKLRERYRWEVVGPNPL